MKTQDYIKYFGNHVRKLRLDRGISQQELANEANLSHSQISRIERGTVNTSIHNLLCISLALNIHPKQLWDFDFKFESGADDCDDFRPILNKAS